MTTIRKDFNFRLAQDFKNKIFWEISMFNKFVLSLALVVCSHASFAGKIVVFDHEEAMLRTKVAQEKFDTLKAKPAVADMIAQGETAKADLQSLSKEANSKGMTWSAEEKAEHRKKIEYIQADMKLLSQKLQAENNGVIGAIMENLQPKLQKVLGSYIEANDIDIVLRKQGTYMAKPTLDITADITAELDKQK